MSSRPSASKTIYLDFTGHLTTGTFWNDGLGDITTSVYSFEGDNTFSNAELTQIQEIWQRTAECYSPFDVNVTTKEPPLSDLINSGGSDTRWGIRVCIGATNPSPAPGAGGVAYLGSFSWNNDTPTFVFMVGSGPYGKYIADATVHEVGHTLSLNHDGRISPSEGYYQGHGSGPTGWAPHMGVGYYQNLVQWSKGEYPSANNTEDDLSIITTQHGFGYRVDDFPNASGTAPAIAGTAGTSVFNVNQSGVIERTTDTDWFKIIAAAGTINLSAVGDTINTMLDIRMDLYNSAGSLVVSNNPVDALTASINQPVAAGTYYVKIEGVGKGDLTTGYSDYSSLGQYKITGTYPKSTTSTNNVTAAYNATAKLLTLTGDGGSNTVNVTVQSGRLTVAGSGGTTINNSSNPFTASNVTGRIGLNALMNAGNDSLSVTGMLGATMNVNQGEGNDTLRLTYCNLNYLVLNGLGGTDVFIPVTSLIKRKSISGVP